MSLVLPEHILKRMAPEDRVKLGKAGRTFAEVRQIAEAKNEKQLQQQLEALLRRREIVPIRQRMDRKSNIAEGLPDFFFAVAGKAVCWEVKMPGQEPRPEQVKMLVALADNVNGWACRVIHSYDEGLSHLAELNHCGL